MIEFDADEVSPMPVVRCIPEVGDSLTARITLSRFFLDTRPFKVIEDATAQLSVNGTPTEVGTYADGEYHFGYIPKAGDKMELKVATPGYDEVTAATTVPNPPCIDTVFMTGTLSEEEQTIDCKVHVVIDDPANETNYYSLRLEFAYVQTIDTVINGNDTIVNYVDSSGGKLYFSVDDPLLQTASTTAIDVVIGGTEVDAFVFSDEMFDGTRHDITLSTYRYLYSPYYANDAKQRLVSRQFKVRAVVQSLSEEIYRYRRSKQGSNPLDGIEIFSEPVQIFSNIEGGIGIFGAVNTVKKEVICEW